MFLISSMQTSTHSILTAGDEQTKSMLGYLFLIFPVRNLSQISSIKYSMTLQLDFSWMVMVQAGLSSSSITEKYSPWSSFCAYWGVLSFWFSSCWGSHCSWKSQLRLTSRSCQGSSTVLLGLNPHQSRLCPFFTSNKAEFNEVHYSIPFFEK